MNIIIYFYTILYSFSLVFCNYYYIPYARSRHSNNGTCTRLEKITNLQNTPVARCLVLCDSKTINSYSAASNHVSNDTELILVSYIITRRNPLALQPLHRREPAENSIAWARKTNVQSRRQNATYCTPI